MGVFVGIAEMTAAVAVAADGTFEEPKTYGKIFNMEEALGY